MTLEDMILVSVDDHVVEPADAFLRHFPEALRARAPKIVSKNGKDLWFWEGKTYPSIGLNAVVGRPRSEYGMEPDAFAQMRPGCYSIKDRIDDMNANGVLGSLCFPSFPGCSGAVLQQTEDKQLALAGIRAYNDWHVHDWCGSFPGRFIPMAILPLWDMGETVAELKRVSRLGVHAVSFPDNPALAGLPSLHNEYWEPMWKALADDQFTINCHIGTGAQAAHASLETPVDAWIITMPMSISNSAADWLFAPMWKEYPQLKMALSEGGIGWIPYFLERADFTYEHHHEWTHTNFGGERPSDVFKRHILTCFIDDRFGLKNLDAMNENMVMWECDYPHSDTVWPKSPEYVHASVAHLGRETIDRVTHGNAMSAYNYSPFAHIPRERCTVGALRAQATDVDVRPRAGLGGLKPIEAEARRKPVTSGDVIKMFQSAFSN
jgi:predicted TIM-barrel fold metal-dependent hydrolase